MYNAIYIYIEPHNIPVYMPMKSPLSEDIHDKIL